MTISMFDSNFILAKTTIALSIRMESTPVDEAAFLNPTCVPVFENATDIVTFPDVEEESGLVDFVHPIIISEIKRKPMIF